MNRINSMARFEEPTEPKLKAQCLMCNASLCEGDDVVNVEDEIFCGTECYLDYYGIRTEIL